MSWDYTDWPVFSSPAGTDPYPDVRSRISAGLASDLGRWATDMCVAYADDTGLTQPPTSTADALDERFADLVDRLRGEGVRVERGERWWREHN